MRTRKRIQKKPRGLSPGTPIYVGREESRPVGIKMIEYSAEEIREETLDKNYHWASARERDSITWINIDGIHDVELVKSICESLDIHSLVIEDIVDSTQRPKFDDHDDYVFLLIRMTMNDLETGDIKTEQLSIIIGQNYVLSFQETPADVFDPVRERLRHGRGRVRKKGSDYLGYALADATVDYYFVVLDIIESRIEDLDEELASSVPDDALQRIHALKREVMALRRSVAPLREVIAAFQKSEASLLEDGTALYMGDLHDHALKVLDSVEGARDALNSIADFYMSLVSNQLNEVMKVLTVMASIFIPLTFIAGIYGMNFEGMPELSWQYGYLYAWVLMVLVAAFTLGYLRKNRWL